MSVAMQMKFPTLPKENGRKSNAVYGSLRRLIMLSELNGGSILTEQSLAHEFACSQGTIREALLRLEQDGLVERRGYQGTFVTSISEAEAEILIHQRIALESAGIARACLNIDTATREFLLQSVEDYRKVRDLGDGYLLSRVDLAFHLKLFERADLPNLMPVLARTLLLVHRFMIAQRVGETFWLDLFPDQHVAIIEPVGQRDPELCRKLMARHVASNIEAFHPIMFRRLFGGMDQPSA